MKRPHNDFSMFSDLSHAVQVNYTRDEESPWENSPFHWISEAQSGRKGAVGKALVRRWAEQAGMQVAGKSGKGHDFQIDGLRVAVKLSLVWTDRLFVFQQIRDQNYDVASLLALEPQRVRLWIVPKEVLWEHAGWQHTGAAGHDTKWLHFQATKPCPWLKPYGGTLPRARRALKQTRGELSS